MPRKSTDEIKADILDSAAALFAQHGFANTSLQQIADSVRYSKAGVLRYFPSKDALYHAAVVAARDDAVALLARVESISTGSDRDKVAVEEAVDLTFARPGISAFSYSLIWSDHAGGPGELEEAGMAILSAFSIDPTQPDEERLVRVMSAMAGLMMSALVAVRLDLKREWRNFIVNAALNSLGHGTSV